MKYLVMGLGCLISGSIFGAASLLLFVFIAYEFALYMALISFVIFLLLIALSSRYFSKVPNDLLITKDK